MATHRFCIKSGKGKHGEDCFEVFDQEGNETVLTGCQKWKDAAAVRDVLNGKQKSAVVRGELAGVLAAN